MAVDALWPAVDALWPPVDALWPALGGVPRKHFLLSDPEHAVAGGGENAVASRVIARSAKRHRLSTSGATDAWSLAMYPCRTACLRKATPNGGRPVSTFVRPNRRVTTSAVAQWDMRFTPSRLSNACYVLCMLTKRGERRFSHRRSLSTRPTWFSAAVVALACSSEHSAADSAMTGHTAPSSPETATPMTPGPMPPASQSTGAAETAPPAAASSEPAPQPSTPASAASSSTSTPSAAGTTAGTTPPAGEGEPDVSGTDEQPAAPELGPDGYPAVCNETREVDPAASQQLTVHLSIEFDGQPLLYGEPNPLPDGGTIMPTNFRFYLSQFELTRGDELVAATLVDSAGAAKPYGVELINTESLDPPAFQLAFPPDTYDGLSFLLGLSVGCNGAAAGAPPLDEASQLKWPHTLGYLFLRFEGQLDEQADPTIPSAVHMGAASGDDGGAPKFILSTPISGGTTAVDVVMSFDALLEGAAWETDLSDFSLLPPSPPTIEEEIYAGERLRRASGEIDLFSVRTP